MKEGRVLAGMEGVLVEVRGVGGRVGGVLGWGEGVGEGVGGVLGWGEGVGGRAGVFGEGRGCLGRAEGVLKGEAERKAGLGCA